MKTKAEINRAYRLRKKAGKVERRLFIPEHLASEFDAMVKKWFDCQLL